MTMTIKHLQGFLSSLVVLFCRVCPYILDLTTCLQGGNFALNGQGFKEVDKKAFL